MNALPDILKSIFDKKIDKGHKSVKSFAAYADIKYDMITKILRGERYPLNILYFTKDVIDFTGDITPAQYISTQLGGIHIPVLNPDMQVNLNNKSFAVLKEAGDVVGKIAEASIDGEITSKEARQILKEWNELLSVAAPFILEISKIANRIGGESGK